MRDSKGEMEAVRVEVWEREGWRVREGEEVPTTRVSVGRAEEERVEEGRMVVVEEREGLGETEEEGEIVGEREPKRDTVCRVLGLAVEGSVGTGGNVNPTNCRETLVTLGVPERERVREEVGEVDRDGEDDALTAVELVTVGATEMVKVLEAVGLTDGRGDTLRTRKARRRKGKVEAIIF